MDLKLKKVLRGISLEIRRLLEGRYDQHGQWQGGDLERRLNELGVWRDRNAKPVEELPQLSTEDKAARRLVDGYLKLREAAGVGRETAVPEFLRESAYTWANRLFALRCMEARGIIDEVILQKDSYGGRSLAHHRFARKHPEACASPDDGLFAVLLAEFSERAKELPLVFDPKSPAVALRPSIAALKRIIALLGGCERVAGQEGATEEVFVCPDAFGWAYQYYQEDEKKRVDEWLKTKKDFKCEGAAIIPKTALYTESYMVKFLVQNSLGAVWMGMYPDSQLCDQWEYYVKEADRTPLTPKPVCDITFLDPAQGSGHFHLEAFDLFYAMYAEEGVREGRTLRPQEIAAAILNHNLYGIDIDGCAVQIAGASVWMRAKEIAPCLEPADLTSFRDHLIATNFRLPKNRDHLTLFLQEHPEDEQLRPALDLVLQGLEHADELGSLLEIGGLVDTLLGQLKIQADRRKGTMVQTALFEPNLIQGTLSLDADDYDKWKSDVLKRLQVHFEAEAQAADPVQAIFGRSAGRALALFAVLTRRYDVVAANPPYLGAGSHGPILAKYLAAHYGSGKSDLYSAFMLRMLDMVVKNGRWAFVSPRGWLTLGTAEELRETIAKIGTLTLGADLGTHAFEEISGEVVSVILCAGEANECAAERSVKFLDLRKSSSKDAGFRSGRFDSFKRPHSLFARLPGGRFAYRLTEGEVAIFQALHPLRDQCFMTIGLICGNNSRFVRLVHEVSLGERWWPYLKTQSSTRWAGEIFEAVDWHDSGARIRARYRDVGATGGKYNGEEFYGTPGISATRVGGGSLKAQLFPCGVLFDSAASCGFTAWPGARQLCCAFLNSPLCQRWARELNGSFNYQAGDLNILPLPTIAQNSNTETIELVERVFRTVEAAVELSPTHFCFHPVTFRPGRTGLANDIDLIMESLATSAQAVAADEARIFENINRIFGFPDGFQNEWEPLELQQFPQASCTELMLTIMSVSVLKLLGHRWPKQVQADEATPAWAEQNGVIPLTGTGRETPLIERVSERLAEDFPAANAAALEREFEESVRVKLEQWLRGPFFEWHISQFKKRPIAWQIETQAGRNRAEGRKKATSGEPVFACLIYYHKLDEDLLPKIRTRHTGPLRAGFETELRTLERLASPTADQQGRKLQLDQRIEELKAFDAKLEQVSLTGFGPEAVRPALRQFAINDALLSLTARWLTRLEGGVRTGDEGRSVTTDCTDYHRSESGPEAVGEGGKEVSAAGPLAAWQSDAATTGLHPGLAVWMEEAFSRLDFFCVAVGPKAAGQKTFVSDPSSKELAALVCVKAAETVGQVLNLACERWWKKFEETVLVPLKDLLKQAREEQERVKAELQLDAVKRDHARQTELADRKDELKQRIKSLREEMEEKTAEAKRLRSQIEAWTCPEAETWEGWLGAQPLFDAVASLDGKRPAPATIAEFIAQESAYSPDLNDGVRVNIAPIQKAGLLHADVLDAKDAEKAVSDRAEWRSDERRWVREGKLPQPGWWETTKGTA